MLICSLYSQLEVHQVDVAPVKLTVLKKRVAWPKVEFAHQITGKS